MFDRVGTAMDLARKGYWSLFAAKTLRTLHMELALRHLTCRINVPEEPVTHGLRLYVELGDWISDDICRYGLWEPVLTRYILAHARKGGLFVDVGANLGYYSLLWAGARPDNRVYAIDASPLVFPRLLRNVKLNGLERQVRAFEIAVSDHEGLSSFALRPEGQLGAGSLAPEPEPDTIDVVTTCLDTLFSSLPRIDVLKTDAEGFDTHILRGSETLLREHRIGAVYYEQITDRMAELGVDAGEAASMLERYGYVVTCLPNSHVADDGRVTLWQGILR
jgi:FkbM family methyltransferase